MSRTSSQMPARVEGHEHVSLATGWQAIATAPDLCLDPSGLKDLRDWCPASVPGTAAGVMQDTGRWQLGDRTTFDAEHVRADEEVLLVLDGLATVAEVFLNGELILESDSMFARHAVDVGAVLRETNELAIRCRALGPLLEQRRRPRARWRTRLVAEGNLRFFRTMLMGRAPGFAPGPAAVGPWRPVFLERRRRLVVEMLELRPRIAGDDGVLAIRARLRSLDGTAPASVELELSGPAGSSPSASLQLESTPLGPDCFEVSGELIVTDVVRWWPHTHGTPALYGLRLIVESEAGRIAIDGGRVGFRSLSFGPSIEHEVLQDGIDLHLNGVRVFARGAVWTPIDVAGLAPTESELRRALTQVREAGMNMLRLPGTGAYEDLAFHDLCDELGILVWQDFMFANLDYPISVESFRATVEEELVQVLEGISGRPSLAVLCGNSEVEQQVAMLGLDPALGRGELFGELLPALVSESGVDACYLPSAPCGGELPFRPDRGIANYYGVGAYRQPLTEVRRADVRFAAECLAFSNVPEESALERMLPDAPSHALVRHAVWNAGVPRDPGASWDFEDVRDHYLQLLFEVDSAELRRVDHERYLELSRIVTGEVMAEVFGEWRRSHSPCGGGLVLWLRDLAPGAGWGLIDCFGEPKTVYHHLRRALAPVAVWTVDEGLSGIVAHAANDRPTPLNATLRVSLYRDFEQRVEETRIPVELEAHTQAEWNVETLLGHFADVGWSYRFGPPAQNLIVCSLEQETEHGAVLLSQSTRFPAGRPRAVEPAVRLGLRASVIPCDKETMRLSVCSNRLAYGVRVNVPGFAVSDDAFSVEPGGERVVTLHPHTDNTTFVGGTLTAVNLQGRISIAAEEQPS